MSDEITKPGAPSGAEAAGSTPPPRNQDEVALDLMKFIAVTTGYGKGIMGGTGFSGKPNKSSEEYAAALLQLFEKCRAVVAAPVIPKDTH